MCVLIPVSRYFAAPATPVLLGDGGLLGRG